MATTTWIHDGNELRTDFMENSANGSSFNAKTFPSGITSKLSVIEEKDKF